MSSLLVNDHTIFFDESDLHVVHKYKWHIHKGKRTFYARTNVRSGRGYKKRFLHQLLLPGERIIDHRDGNGLNNRRSNLRACSANQNQWNRRVSKASSSGVKGVYWHKHIKKWQASICVNRHLIFLGYFKQKNEAILAYAKAAEAHFGEFARTNE